MDKKVAKIYGDKVRVRACGLCWREDSLLMVNHAGITNGDFWSPPGGGVDFGFSIEDTLMKELKEETGLQVAAGDFLFGCEYIEKPIHSIELFYSVKEIDGEMIKGCDPEIQIIKAVKFMSWEDINALPPTEVHGIFRRVNTRQELLTLRGFFRI